MMEIKVTERAMMRPATQEDIDLVEGTLRVGDRAECEIFANWHHAECEIFANWHQNIAEFETCWAIFGHGKLVGYCGVMVHPGQTALAPVRWLCFLSTQAADTMKVSFVKDSRAVMREIVRHTPEHVTRFISMPAAAYHGSVIWHERVLKMQRSQEVLINNHKHIVYTIDRKDVLT